MIKPRVGVVGGGLIGQSIAWRLAQRGLDVTLFERRELGAGASFAAAGMLSVVAEAEPGRARFFELGRESRRRWSGFAAELETASGLRVSLLSQGTLLIARDAAEEAQLAKLALAHAGDGTMVRLAPEEWSGLEPALSRSVQAVYAAPEDGQVDNRAVLTALAKAGVAAGVQVRRNTPVTRILTSGGGIGGLETVAGREDFDAVVLACAAGTDGLLAASGLQGVAPPISPVKGQLLAVEMDASKPIIRSVLRAATGPYLVPRSSGRLIVGATSEPGIEDAGLTAAARSELWQGMVGLVPATADLPIVDHWCGLRPRPPSGVPIIGSAGPAGLILAVGHYRNGVLLTPITADLVCGLLTGSLTNAERELLIAFAPPEGARPTAVAASIVP